MYQTSENIASGSDTFDAFHAALSGGAIISSGGAYDGLDGVERVRLDPEDAGDSEG